MKMYFLPIRTWANARNLINGCGPKDQMLKLTEEMGEMVEGVTNADLALTKDGLGDCAVVLTILAAQLGANIEDYLDAGEIKVLNPFTCLQQHMGTLAAGIARNDKARALSAFGALYLCLDIIAQREGLVLADCIAAAYEEIKDRKGTMINGIFIKEGDTYHGQ